MTESDATGMDAASATLAAVAREDRARLLAGLIRRAGGDFERAEDALSDAFTAALTRWPEHGIPREPAAWLATVAARRLAEIGRASCRESV